MLRLSKCQQHKRSERSLKIPNRLHVASVRWDYTISWAFNYAVLATLGIDIRYQHQIMINPVFATTVSTQSRCPRPRWPYPIPQSRPTLLRLPQLYCNLPDPRRFVSST